MALEELKSHDSGTLRIVIVSDTHERHRLVSVPAGDVFLHCGDICMSSSLSTRSRGERVLRDFNDWLEQIPCKEKVVIGGNHDAVLCDLGSQAADILSAAVWLQDSSVKLPQAGIKVYGNAYSEGHSHNCAWQTNDGNAPPIDEDACKDADVVLTHHCTASIREAVMTYTRPRLWASGHAHNEHGIHEKAGTVFVNAAIQDTHYNPFQSPVVLDIPITNIAS